MQRINHHSKKERKAGIGEKDEGRRKMIAALRALNIRLPNELTILDVEGKVHRLKHR